MASITTYLTFNGNCREAMTFYQQCLGGELFFQAIGESPMADKMPERVKNYILHSTLTNGNLSLMASDMTPDKGLIKGNAVSLMLDCDSEEQVRSLYEKLSEGGEKTHPLEHTFWGALFGDFTDRFGNQWLLHFQTSQNR